LWICNLQSTIGNRQSAIGNRQSGAALVIVIAVLTILLAIGLTFLTVSRMELKTVTNIENTVRADLLADAATNIAISFLAQDEQDHPTVTSLDHAWRTYFNGAWVQGKLWAFPEQWTRQFVGFADPGSVPTIFFTPDGGAGIAVPGGGGIGHLYYPRYEPQRDANNRPYYLAEDAYALLNNPYVIDPLGPTLAADQVNRWADIDNDGDGLRDSVWIPLVGDTFVGNNEDGTGGDGVDNNLDGTIDETSETPVFLYYGGNDGLDNDNVNTLAPTVDDAAEQRWYLTAPINSLYDANGFYLILRGVYIPKVGNIDINTNPDQKWPLRWVDVLDNDYDLVHNKHFEYYTPTRPTWPTTPPYNDTTRYPDPIVAWNSYIADTSLHPPLPIRVLTNLPAPYYPPNEFDQLQGVTEIDHDRYLGVDFPWRVKSTGEPVCEIVGRAAILINDEASKVNLNVAGGHTLDLAAAIADGVSVADFGARRKYWMPASANGLTTSQYCNRVLPGVGPGDSGGDTVGRSQKLWGLLTGAPDGGVYVRVPGDVYPPTIVALPDEYVLDALSPGYGLVDDNGNSLMLAMNGIDDDGDGMIDEGVNPAYPEYLGLFEGVDEPGELQRINPYPDLVAQGKIPMSNGQLDDPNTDANRVVNARSRLGDSPLRTREEAKLAVATEVPPPPYQTPYESFYGDLRDLVTLNSTDKNNRFKEAVQYNPLLPPAPITSQADGNLRSSGLKVDYNYASAATIAHEFIDDWGLATPTSTPYFYYVAGTESPATAFATGLQQEGVNVGIITGDPNQVFHSPIQFILNNQPFTGPYPADPQLRALQLATNIVDGRDTDYARTTETMTVKDTWWEGQGGGARDIKYTIAGCEGIRITEMMVRPVRRVEAEMTRLITSYTETELDAYLGYPQVQQDGSIYFCPNILPIGSVDFDMSRLYMGDRIPSSVLDPISGGSYTLTPGLLPPYWPSGSISLPYVGTGAGVIGPDSALRTTNPTIPVNGFAPDGTPLNPQEWPNGIQFRFGPGPGLPPGKYYLTINTIDPASGQPTVTADRTDQIRFAVKYASATGYAGDMPLSSTGMPMSVSTQDILADVRDSYVNALPGQYDFFDEFTNRWFSQRPPPLEQPLLPGMPIAAGGNLGEVPGWVFLATVDDPTIGDGYGQDQTFTVTIPPYVDPARPQDQVYLYVAICPGTQPGASLAINFFDFSQEPDHEWVEIENVTGHAVDVSGWTLTVGGVDQQGKIVTADHVDMRIPDRMTLDQNSPVMLESRPPNNRLILAVNALDFLGKQGLNPGYVTDNFLMDNGIGLIGADLSPLNGQPPGSPPWDFSRISSPAVQPPPAPPPPLLALPPSAMAVFSDPQAARRVVQVEITGLTGPGAIATVDDVAKWVLRGGVFPDYPEHDGIDNDNDGSILASDGVDHNGDGTVGDVPPLYEGIDEGGYLMDVKQTNGWAMPSPGGFDAVPVRFTANAFLPLPADSSVHSYNNDFLNPTDPTHRDYLGSSEQPPEWKEFVERRFFPGDNVIVTLFDKNTRVVDRVTYTERDVINRAIDDGIEIPFTGTGAAQIHGRVTLYEEGSGTILPDIYLRFWPNNTMMLDFYRTLERKYHPLYNGDRFGTSNRWEATDGNYDDWSHFPVIPKLHADDTPDEQARAMVVAQRNFNGTPLARNDAAFDLRLSRYAQNMDPDEMDLTYLGTAAIESFDGIPADVSNRVSQRWAYPETWYPSRGCLVGTLGLIDYEGPPLPDLPYRLGDPRDAFRWKDYQFTCDFKPVGPMQTGSTVGFVFRYGRDGNTIRYYRVQVQVRPDGAADYSIIKHWGGGPTDGMPLAGRTGPPLSVYAGFPDNTQPPLLFEVKLEGVHIYATVNGVALEAWDNQQLGGNPYIPDGTVGLYCDAIPQDSLVAFDNVYVNMRDRNRPYRSAEDALTQPYLALNRAFHAEQNVYGNPEFTSSQPLINADGTPYSGDAIVWARDVVSGSGQKAVQFPQGLRLGDSYPLDVNAVVSTVAEDRVLLTAGQASFTLLWPTDDTANRLKWSPPPGPWVPPQVWRPVFLYSLSQDEVNNPATSFRYMYRVTGLADADFPRLGAVDPYNFLFNNMLAGTTLPWLAPDKLLSRYRWPAADWTKDSRVVMYVSGNLALFDPKATSTPQRPDPTANRLPVSAEALFEWTAEDGLENGQYDIYLDMGAYMDTFRDADREKLQYGDYAGGIPDNSGLLTTLGRGLYGLRRAPDEFRLPPYSPPLSGYEADEPGLMDPSLSADITVDAELFTDEDGDGGCWSKAPYPTWSTLNRGDPWATPERDYPGNPSGLPPNGIDDDRDGSIDDGPALPDGRPNPWANPEKDVTNGIDDDQDGRIDDAASESFGQQPGLAPGLDGYVHCGSVRVKHNYLALYLRNWTVAGRLNRFLGLILTPRDRTSGRININTVETRAFRDDRNGPTRLFNALIGVPGVLFDEGQQYIAPDGAPTPPRLIDYGLTEPTEGAPVPLPGLPQIILTDPPQLPPVTNLLDRARLIEVGRPGTWPGVYEQYRRDGRYYASLSELLGYDSEFDYGGTALHPLTIKVPTPVSGIPQNPQWYDEIGTRFGKMANLITTRSDVFEILVTVQAGYGVDANRDGQINWRSNDEFVVTAEKTTRTVYER
jgi:hypothetical protein